MKQTDPSTQSKNLKDTSIHPALSTRPSGPLSRVCLQTGTQAGRQAVRQSGGKGKMSKGETDRRTRQVLAIARQTDRQTVATKGYVGWRISIPPLPLSLCDAAMWPVCPSSPLIRSRPTSSPSLQQSVSERARQNCEHPQQQQQQHQRIGGVGGTVSGRGYLSMYKGRWQAGRQADRQTG